VQLGLVQHQHDDLALTVNGRQLAQQVTAR
jgi:hypothetical protein